MQSANPIRHSLITYKYGFIPTIYALSRHSDPTHKQEERIFEMLGYIDIQYLAQRIQADVMWAIGLMDTICPPSSQFAVYNKICAPKMMTIYPDFGHEPLPGLNDQVFQFMMGL